MAVVLQSIWNQTYSKVEAFLKGTDSYDYKGVFYYNSSHLSKQTQWTHPKTGKMKKVTSDLPIGWEKRVEESSGKVIYFDTINQRETYIDPRLVFAAEEVPNNISEVRQRFDASSKALQILHGKDLNGKIAVITGANCGIGLETAKSLAFHGCEVIFACRNEQTTLQAIAEIEKERPKAAKKCRFVKLDLASLRSTKDFIENIRSNYARIDFLILNAGVFGLPHSLSEDGYETTFQVCHLSHFYIATSLIDCLDKNSRVLVLSSESHRFANLPSHGLTEELLSPPASKYWSMMAYNNVKLCNVLFARELAKRLQNTGVSVFALHPGNMVSTGLPRSWFLMRILFFFVRPFTKSLQQAAATTIYCATAEELSSLTGLYFNNCFICEPSQISQNDELCEELWNISEKMIEQKLKSYE